MSNYNSTNQSFVKSFGFGSNSTINESGSNNLMTPAGLDEQRLYGHQQVGTPSADFERTSVYQQRLYQNQDEVNRQIQSRNLNPPQTYQQQQRFPTPDELSRRMQSLDVNAPQPPPHAPPTQHTTQYSRPPLTSPIQNRPFSSTSDAHSGSTASLTSLPQVPKEDNNPFLFAAMRVGEDLILVTPKKDKRFVVNEKMLKETCGIELGDFMKANVVGDGGLANFMKKNLSEFPDFRFQTRVEGDIVHVNNVFGTVSKVSGGHTVFSSKHFSDALIIQNANPGKYNARLILRKMPTEAKVGPQVVTYNFDVIMLKPVIHRNNNRRVPTNNKVVGTGFSEEKPAASKAVIGAGFQEKSSNVKLRAVVTSFSVNKEKQFRLHYLWLLDKHAEGFFKCNKVGKNAAGEDEYSHELGPGYFFEGTFVESNNKKGQYTCKDFGKPISIKIPGGLQDGQIWFTTKISNYQKGFNDLHATVQSQYFGSILDINDKLSAGCNGKNVKIERKGFKENEYAWVVTEVL